MSGWTRRAIRTCAIAIALAMALCRVGRGQAPSPTATTISESPPVVDRRPGPSGSLVLVESNHALPLVHVVVALRSGSAWDPHKKDGLANLMGEVARRGAAGKGRADIDARIDALGATLEVHTDPDSLRLEGHVLGRHLDRYLAIIADILLRPDFTAAEFARTRRQILADIDELRIDDHALGRRFFVRNLFGDHPYGHSAEGDRASLERIRREDLLAFQRQHVVGPNVVFAATGDVSIQELASRIAVLFSTLPRTPGPGPNPLAIRQPQPPRGWRVQIVDKPDRQQAHILFGQLGVRATDPDFVPLLVAISSFGGHGMKSTLMDEIRTKRGLAYGAYMSLSERLGRGSVAGWVFSSADKAVPTLKMVLRLYVALMDKGIDDRRLTFAKTFLAGTEASLMDDPARRLEARVSAEIVGLPPTFVDELPARVRAVTAAEVKGALVRNVHAHDLAITVVATGAQLRQRLIDAQVQPSAIDVLPYDGY
jgi:zinc protease